MTLDTEFSLYIFCRINYIYLLYITISNPTMDSVIYIYRFAKRVYKARL